MENFNKFRMRLMEKGGAPLVKALDPQDFSTLLLETNPNGGEVVDHTKELSAHPPHMNPKVEHYRNAISGQAPLMRHAPLTLTGVTAKAVFALPHSGNMSSPDRAIVKPYHEAINPRAKFWQHHPIQGWAEMTNQSLWHAADMGHMHQNVHVSEHSMGPGHEKEPGVVIHMAPDADFVYRMGPRQYEPSMHDELPKIAAMDFLTNNMDRHQANLMFLPHGAVDHNGQPVRSRLLAIDHGRSFQYHASNKGAPKQIKDPLLGTIAVDEDIRNAFEREGKTNDNLLNYASAKGIQEVAQLGHMFGKRNLMSPEGLIPILEKWWPQVRDRVVQTMEQRIENLREPRMQEHIRKNFMERVKLLDNIANNPDYYKYQARVKDLEVPLHIWNRDDNENPNP